MRRKLITLMLLMTIAITGCYFPISGRVIDAESQQPIEGAVVLVEWTKTHGLGEHWTESAKVVEAVSDKDGKVKISGCYDPFVSPPDVTIYKKGYVAWNNYYIFPNSEHRTNFSWQSGYVFKLEKFLNTYSYLKHNNFVEGAAHLGMADDKKKTFEKYYDESESEKVQGEQKELDRSRRLPK